MVSRLAAIWALGGDTLLQRQLGAVDAQLLLKDVAHRLLLLCAPADELRHAIALRSARRKMSQ